MPRRISMAISASCTERIGAEIVDSIIHSSAYCLTSSSVASEAHKSNLAEASMLARHSRSSSGICM